MTAADRDPRTSGERLEVARITITLAVAEGDVRHYVEAIDEAGDVLPLVQALGMLRMAEDSLIRDAMDET